MVAVELSSEVSMLVHDALRVRSAPQRVELYDDVAASAIREWCLAFQDVRANVLEVVNRWDELRHMQELPGYEQQVLALEALQVFAPLGHALGLGSISAQMEDVAFKTLFPQSYSHTSDWLRREVGAAEDALFVCQRRLLDALDQHPRFQELAQGCVIRARTKSLFSCMKKILRLGNTQHGGRQRSEIYDLLGMRVVVQPRQDLPPEEAEARAREACAVVRELAEAMWAAVRHRTKDYITHPKPNGYQSIHMTLRLGPGGGGGSQPSSPSSSSSGGGGGGSGRSSRSGSGVAAAAEAAAQAAAAARGPWRPSCPTGSMASVDSGCGDAIATAGQGQGQGLYEGPGECPALGSVMGSMDEAGMEELQAAGAGYQGGQGGPFMELQIRTQEMDMHAESGEAAHAAYKGGLDSQQARQLQAWTRELQQRMAAGRPPGSKGAARLPAPSPVLPVSLSAPVLSLQPGPQGSSEVAAAGSSSGSGSSMGASTQEEEEEILNKRQHVIASMASMEMEEEDVGWAAALFAHIDRDRSGRITIEELSQLLRELSGKGSQQRRQQLQLQQEQQQRAAWASAFAAPGAAVGAGFGLPQRWGMAGQGSWDMPGLYPGGQGHAAQAAADTSLEAEARLLMDMLLRERRQRSSGGGSGSSSSSGTGLGGGPLGLAPPRSSSMVGAEEDGPASPAPPGSGVPGAGEEEGIGVRELARYLRRVSMLGALQRVDEATAEDLRSGGSDGSGGKA